MSAEVILTATAGSLEGRLFAFPEHARCVIGRAPDCTLRVPDGDGFVSRRHCLLEIDVPAVYVRDLGSKNGTYVNGQLIGRRDSEGLPARALEPGEEIQVGSAVFRVRIVLGPPEDAPPPPPGRLAILVDGRPLYPCC